MAEGNDITNALNEIVKALDPDDVVSFYGSLVDHFRNLQTETIESLLTLFDPDTCPPDFLPYLAYRIGIRLSPLDSTKYKRQQIRSAVQWYKLKGLEEAYKLRFQSIGYDVDVIPLWASCDDQCHYVFNKDGCNEFDEPSVVHPDPGTLPDPLTGDYKPIARIDVIFKFTPDNCP